jgi:hypothetical protein
MTPLRRWLGIGACALAVCTAGCNVLSLPFFLMGPEPSVEPSLKRLATDDKDKKIKVAVIAASNIDVRSELTRVDRELAAQVVKHLTELCKYNDENVVVLPVNIVERYKTDHPDWDHPLDLARIGQDLKVRYVVYLQIDALTLYVPKSNNQFYQGESDIKVTLVNVRKPDDPPEEDICHEIYPESPISTFDDPNALAFRQKYLAHVAEKIAWKFTKHPTEKDYGANK